jgi:N-acetylglucosaminyldiphosphoundecaprenol N-acetyl-beta-D-mannosaminyltransferase
MAARIKFLNTFVNITDKKDYLNIISSSIDKKDKKVFFYLNTHSFYLLNKDKEFFKLFNQTDFITPDGYSIKRAIRFLYNEKIEKVSFNHCFYSNLRKVFSDQQSRIFLLGGNELTIRLAAEKLQFKEPKLNIIGYNHGYFDPINDTEKILDKINCSYPEIILIGMGMPDSVIWTGNNRDKINANLIFTVGNLFDIVAGEKRLAPKSLYNTPFEWIYRLIQEPKKLFFRYIKTHTYFLFVILKTKWQNLQQKALV